MSELQKSKHKIVDGYSFLFIIAFFFRYTKQTISDLLQNKVDMSQLVITKALAKTGTVVDRVVDYIFSMTMNRLCR